VIVYMTGPPWRAGAPAAARPAAGSTIRLGGGCWTKVQFRGSPACPIIEVNTHIPYMSVPHEGTVVGRA
jgi:hypothetical protein